MTTQRSKRFVVVSWIHGLTSTSRGRFVRQLDGPFACEWKLGDPSVDDDVFELFGEASTREEADEMLNHVNRVCAGNAGLTVRGQWAFAFG